MLRILALLLVAVALGQNPLFAQVGDPLPDGMGQLIAAADFENDGDVEVNHTFGRDLISLPRRPAEQSFQKPRTVTVLRFVTFEVATSSACQ
jgi:hypothetical protein